MQVYYRSERAEQSASYPVTVSPAGDTAFVKSVDVLDDWRLADGRPKQFEIVFKFGAAEVDDALGRYMVARGIAHKHRDWLGSIKKLIGVQAPKLYDASGRPIEAFDEGGRPIVIDGNVVS
jgi:hypothetical protein